MMEIALVPRDQCNALRAPDAKVGADRCNSIKSILQLHLCLEVLSIHLDRVSSLLLLVLFQMHFFMLFLWRCFELVVALT